LGVMRHGNIRCAVFEAPIIARRLSSPVIEWLDRAMGSPEEGESASRGGPCQDAGMHWIVHLSASLRGDTPFAAFARPLRTSLLLPARYLPRLLRFATTDASTNGVHCGGPASSALTSIATLPFMRADASVAGAVQSGSAGSDWLTHPASLRSQRSSPAAPASQGSPSLQTRSLLPWTSEVCAPATSSSR